MLEVSDLIDRYANPKQSSELTLRKAIAGLPSPIHIICGASTALVAKQAEVPIAEPIANHFHWGCPSRISNKPRGSNTLAVIGLSALVLEKALPNSGRELPAIRKGSWVTSNR